MKRQQVFTILFLMITSCIGKQWDRAEYLDPQKKFQLSWNVTETYVIFELLVNTTGWIGIGISANGEMTGADIHVGWVEDGNIFLTDRFGGDYNGFPPLDDGQDLVLIEGWECGGQTSITFKRQLAACDPEQDRPITKNTIRLIYAYNNADPIGGELMPQDIHSFRGVKSVLLFEKEKERIDPDEDVLGSFSVLNDGSPMSTASTYYHCRIVEIPAFDSKHHVIKIEPVIEKQNTRYIHHMVLNVCPPQLTDPSQVGRGADCYGGTLADWRQCLHVMAGWAVGSGAMTFPKDVGFPIGVPDQSRYVSLSIHYTNPLHADIIDHSGFKFVYTSQLRKHDAGMIALSHYLAGYNLVVPPNSQAFDIHMSCDAGCIGGAMDVAKVTSINIIGVFLHTHLTGRKVSLRHIRNGTELPPISSDDEYDYDFQETRIISPSRKVLKGDRLDVTCTFSTAGKNKFVEGGLGTNEEMCAAFFYFYPYIPLTICNSAPHNGLSTVNKLLGVTAVKPVNASPNFLLNRFRNLLITSPDEMSNQTLDVAINNFRWTDKKRESLSRGFRQDSLDQLCFMGPQSRFPFISVIDPPQQFLPYVDSRPKPVCVKSSSSSSTSHAAESCSVTSQ